MTKEWKNVGTAAQPVLERPIADLERSIDLSGPEIDEAERRLLELDHLIAPVAEEAKKVAKEHRTRLKPWLEEHHENVVEAGPLKQSEDPLPPKKRSRLAELNARLVELDHLIGPEKDAMREAAAGFLEKLRPWRKEHKELERDTRTKKRTRAVDAVECREAGYYVQYYLGPPREEVPGSRRPLTPEEREPLFDGAGATASPAVDEPDDEDPDPVKPAPAAKTAKAKPAAAKGGKRSKKK